MKEILLSVVSPLKIKKYRFMTVFIAMLIFVVSVYVLSFPNKVVMNMNKDTYLSEHSYVNAYMNLPEDIALSQEFINNQYKINDKYEMTSVLTSTNVQKYYFENIKVKLAGQDEKTINIHIVFDLSNTMEEGLKKVKEEYTAVYSEDQDERVSYATYLIYVDWIKLSKEEQVQSWKDAKINEYHNEDLEVLKTKMSKLTNFDLFNISINSYENNYCLMFFKDYAVSQIAYYDEEADKITYPSLQLVYSSLKMNLDFSEFTKLNEFGNYFADQMFEPLRDTDQTKYILQVVGYVLLFPAVFVLFLSWSMKKHGTLKTYKEYYNVAAISSLLPLLISFIVLWFAPNLAPMVYGASFSLYTLFVFIKINSTPELLD